jgi:hypothetical protein
VNIPAFPRRLRRKRLDESHGGCLEQKAEPGANSRATWPQAGSCSYSATSVGVGCDTCQKAAAKAIAAAARARICPSVMVPA